ncbi:MAG TPA: ADP-ribosylglycohydrolase family protein [Chloroflexota bacterium]|jgi:ADP-ribosylglycohydrolase|nr:ADP-ribosylglycohydrolase family protein [Chloroflexota bacterium]
MSVPAAAPHSTTGPAGPGPETKNRLYDKIYACNAAGTIGNSMGDVTEGLTWRQIEERYGFVETLLPQEKPERRRESDWGPAFHYKAHSRPPGMTEDGQERHRLMCEAIIRKGGRATVWDLARTWIDLIDESKFGYLLGPQDQVILMSLKAGIPAHEVGRYAAWPGFIGTSKMIEPVGLVNACNPYQAALDAHDVGRLKDVHGRVGRPGNYALEVAAGIAAGVAEAMKPQATVGGVIDTVLGELSSVPRREVQEGLTWAKEHKDWKSLRALYDDRYRGHPISNAVEILSSALAVFYLTDGDPEQALLASVNFGRDCDCRAYVAGGLAATLRGTSTIRQEWIDTIEQELPTDPYTVSRRGLKDTADGLYQATLHTLQEAQRQAELITALL